MKKIKKELTVVLALILGLSLVVTAAMSPQDPAATERTDQPSMEAAHERLLSDQDAAREASRLTEALAAALPESGSGHESVARNNFVDDYIFGKMDRDAIPHAPLSSDSEFLRRVYMDATGLLPTPDQIRAFVADTNPDKRDKVIDSLIGSESFTDQWAYHFGELLRTRDPSFHLWTKDWLRVDRPYDEVFYDIVTPVTKSAKGFATAMTFYDPIGYSANRCITWSDPDSLQGFNRLDWVDEITSDVGRVFLGLTLDCFSCHDGAGHTESFNLFLSRMRRTDFWQQAAFFGNMRNVGSSATMGEAAVFYNGSSLFDDLAAGYDTGNDGNYYTPAEGRFPRDGRTYEPAFLLTGEEPTPGESPRKALGRILPTHIQFARATVNVVWRQLMVVGLVEPYDGFDMDRLDPENPPPAPWTLQPTHPELLNALAEDFRENNFSIHRVIKTIMKSSAYQLSTRFPGEWTDAYIPYYARRFARALTGPEVVDIIAQATEVPYSLEQFGEERNYVKEMTNPLLVKGRLTGGNEVGENAQVFAFMQAFYQAERALPPVEKNVTSPVQAMMLMNSDVVMRRVSANEEESRVARLLRSGQSDDAMIEELYLSTLSRPPTAGEVEVAKRLIAEDRTQGTEKLQWALLNSAEFVLNH